MGGFPPPPSNGGRAKLVGQLRARQPRFSVFPPTRGDRACADLRHSLANATCADPTPIKLISRAHAAAAVNEFSAAGGLCHFFKCDRRSAYKALPAGPSQTKFSAVVLKFPIDGKYYAFESKTLAFGSVGSVPHYNAFARIATELVNRIFGIPLISFPTILEG